MGTLETATTKLRQKWQRKPTRSKRRSPLKKSPLRFKLTGITTTSLKRMKTTMPGKDADDLAVAAGAENAQPVKVAEKVARAERVASPEGAARVEASLAAAAAAKRPLKREAGPGNAARPKAAAKAVPEARGVQAE